MSEMELPEWLTEDFLKESLEANRENFAAITIVSFTTEPAVPPGNNYGSDLIRVRVKYRRESDLDEQSVSLIVKAPLTDGFMKSLGEGYNLFYERELIYYNKFISETYKIFIHDIVPKHYPSLQPHCLLLEDLESLGYTMVSRHDLLDFDHCRLYIESSAKLHALSVALSKTRPDVIQSISKELPQVQKQIEEMSNRMMMKALLSMAAYLEDKPDYENCASVINRIIQHFSVFQEVHQQMDKRERQVKAVVQTDPWCTNMMFKYESGTVVKVKLLDFQNLKFTTPVLEFITFFWLSVTPEVREQKSNDLHHLYCDSLNRNLEHLGCSEKLSYQDFKAEILSLSPLVLMLLCSMLPFCIYDGVPDLNQCIAEDISNKNIKETVFYSLYSGPAFNRYYPQILKQAEKEGVFEYLADVVK